MQKEEMSKRHKCGPAPETEQLADFLKLVDEDTKSIEGLKLHSQRKAT